jgi:hypothetical protein
MKLVITQFSPADCYILPLMSKYSTQHPVLKHPQPHRHRHDSNILHHIKYSDELTRHKNKEPKDLSIIGRL